MFGNNHRKEIKKLSRELKDGVTHTGTFDGSVGGVAALGYRVEKYTPIKSLPDLQRGLMFKVLQDGTELKVISAHESGEPVNAGNYEHQRELAIRYARQESAAYFEVDHDKIEEVMAERRRV